MKIFGIVACVLLAASLYVSKTNGANDGQTAKTVRGFVQGFYSWYVPESVKAQEQPVWNVALQSKRAAFSPALFRALKEDSEAQAKATGEIVGLDFDPFLNTQDPCDRYQVGAVIPQRAGYRVDIYGVCSGKRNEKPDVIADVVPKDGSWAFANFLYPAIHKDLLDTLKTLREDRQKSR